MTEDEKFLETFETCTLPFEQWHHREHIKVAYLYLCRYPLDQAIEKTRSGIKALNAVHRVPEEKLDRGYHETITLAWLHLVHCALCEFGPTESADAFLEKQTQFLAKRALLFFYSRDRIMSWEAKREFIEPDLAPLPRSSKRPSFQS
jgi:hypothetical protein